MLLPKMLLWDFRYIREEQLHSILFLPRIGILRQSWFTPAYPTICFSSIITWPIVLRFHMLILDIGPHNHLVFDFWTSTQKWGQTKWGLDDFIIKLMDSNFIRNKNSYDCSISGFSISGRMTGNWGKKNEWWYRLYYQTIDLWFHRFPLGAIIC